MSRKISATPSRRILGAILIGRKARCRADSPLSPGGDIPIPEGGIERIKIFRSHNGPGFVRAEPGGRKKNDPEACLAHGRDEARPRHGYTIAK